MEKKKKKIEKMDNEKYISARFRLIFKLSRSAKKQQSC